MEFTVKIKVMTAANYDFQIEQGATFKRVLELKDSSNVAINLTGYSAKMQIRQQVDSAVITELTNSSGLAITPLLGKIEINISATATLAYTFEFATYDLIITSAGGEVTRIIEGSITLDPAVTK